MQIYFQMHWKARSSDRRWQISNLLQSRLSCSSRILTQAFGRQRVGPAAAVDGHVPRVDFTLRLLQLVAVQCLLDEWKNALLQSDMGFEQLLELYQRRLQFRHFRPLQLALKPVELLMLLQHLHHCRVAELGIAQAGNQAILFQ